MDGAAGYAIDGQDGPEPRAIRAASVASGNYQGRHYRIANAYCEPRPDPIPPIMVGGGGEKYLLRVVARHADWWNYVVKDRESYARKQDVLKRHCLAVGRDYDQIKQVVATGILIAETEKEVERLTGRPEVRPLDDGIAGTPPQVTEKLLAAIEQGAQRITVWFADAPRLEGTYLFAATVLPHLTARAP